MKIPSYDDLAPSISDVHPRDTFDYAARVIPRSNEPVVSAYAMPATRYAPQRTEPSADAHEARGGSVVAGAAAPIDCRASRGVPALFACLPALFAGLRTQRAARPGALNALAREFSPRIERDGETAAVLDVSGLEKLLGDAHGIANELARTASDHGVKVRLALAPTATAVRLLTLHHDAPVVTMDVAGALAALPLTALRALGVMATHGELQPSWHTKLFETLARWGLRTIGELAALPPDELASRFGQNGLAVQRLACGHDPRPLVPDPDVRRFRESMELEWPVDALEPLSFVLARLLDPLAHALERADKGGAALRLDLRLVDKTTHARVLQLPAPMRDPRVLRTLLLLDLESHPPAAAIDIVTVEVDPAPGRIVQFSLLERATPSPETLATLTARLGALVGDTKCGSPVLLDTHRPDTFEMVRFGSGLEPAVRSRRSRIDKTARSFEGGGGTAGGGWSLVAESRAPGSDRPAALGGPMLRRFRPPLAIRVAVERGRPVHVPIDRKGIPGGNIERSAGPWRTSGNWWDTNDRRWDHDEWDVELSDGTVCRIFQARETGQWFMEGVLD